MFQAAEKNNQNLCSWDISPNVVTIHFCEAQFGAFCGVTCDLCNVVDVVGQSFTYHRVVLIGEYS